MDVRADEFFAVFERPVDAVAAAAAMQRAFRNRTWPDDLDVRVRVGIHSGRPTLTDAGYIGIAVHARLFGTVRTTPVSRTSIITLDVISA